MNCQFKRFKIYCVRTSWPFGLTLYYCAVRYVVLFEVDFVVRVVLSNSFLCRLSLSVSMTTWNRFVINFYAAPSLLLHV